MKRIRRAWARIQSVASLGCALLALLSGGCEDDSAIVEPPVYVLLGVVSDSVSGLPLSGAQVAFYDTTLADTTDEDGSYRVPVSFYLSPSVPVLFSRPGYQSRRFLFPEDATSAGNGEYVLNVPLPQQ